MERKSYWLLLLPGICLLTTTLIIPLLSMIRLSFGDGTWSLEAYRTFLSDPFYQKIMFRTIKVSLITTLLTVILGLPTAYVISQAKSKHKGLLMAIILFPLLTNAVVRSFAWMNMLGKKGVINSLLLKMGLISEPLSLMYSELAITIGSVYLFLPVMVTSLVPVLEQIPPAYFEAAESLGAKEGTVFLKIILPLTFPGLMVGSVLVFTGTMSAYTTPSLLGGNQNMMLSTLVYQQANQLSNWTQASLLAFIMILISLLMMKGMAFLEKRFDERSYDER